MSWHLFEWTFRIESPIHIGHKKIMHFYRSKPYIPAKLIWGALTSNLTKFFASNNYVALGEFVNKNFKFTYMYLYFNTTLYYPKFTVNGLMYDNLRKIDFEKQIFSYQTLNSINPDSRTSEHGFLYHIEFINPFLNTDNEEIKNIFLKGYFWVKEYVSNDITMKINQNDIIISYKDRIVSFNNVLQSIIQIGGERKYGFGRIVLENNIKKCSNQLITDFNCEWSEDNDKYC